MADSEGEAKIQFRENTLEEKRKMRRDRNKRKKMEKRQKKEEKKKKRAKELEDAKEATLAAQRYKATARKYMNLWKKTTEVKKDRATLSPITVSFLTLLYLSYLTA